MDKVRRLGPIAALTIFLCICVPTTCSSAQGGSSSAPALDVAQVDTRAIIVQLDHLLAENRHNEAKSAYGLLLKSRASAVEAGLELHSRGGTSSELTTKALCALGADEVPEELSTHLLKYVLLSSSLSDWTKMSCIDMLSRRVDGPFRDLLLRFGTDPQRDPNLRISALRVAQSKWPSESRQTLASLLQSAQEPAIHHKALQYLAGSGNADALPLIEQFVLNRDPATAGSVLSKEYGILILRYHLGASVLPLLASVLRDETWPTEIQERAIDLLARSGLPGGREILSEVRGHAGKDLQTLIDMALGEQE
jgi:hypothetical protein